MIIKSWIKYTKAFVLILWVLLTLIFISIYLNNKKKLNLVRQELTAFKQSGDSYLTKMELNDVLLKKQIMSDYNSPKVLEKFAPIQKNINVSQDLLNNVTEDNKNWLHPNGNYNQNRFVSNSTINLENVKNLKLAFTLPTSVIGPIESSPIISNGIIFVSTAFNNIYSFNGRTGALLWHFRYENELGDNFQYNCCGPNNRGLAIYHNKLFMGTLDGHLLCINGNTGKLLWKTLLAKSVYGYSISAAPVVVNNKVIIGIGDGDTGIKGFVSALDTETGKLLWTFKTIPDKGQEGSWKTEDVFGNKLRRNIEEEKKSLVNFNLAELGGAGVWTSPAIDLKNNLIIFGAGNATPENEAFKRPGDNLFSNSLVALDLNTGKYKWHFQYLPHENKNFDTSSSPILFDYEETSKNGFKEKIEAVSIGSKSGNIFTHNRVSGKLLNISTRMVPQEPSISGGISWSPMSYNPKLNLIYSINKVTDNKVTDNLNKNKSGRLVATNPVTGKIKWHYDGSLINGGVLSLSAGLVFFGEGNGDINMLNAENGQKLWSYKCDAGANGVPSSYKIEKDQYLIIGCSGNRIASTPRGNKFYVFNLGPL